MPFKKFICDAFYVVVNAVRKTCVFENDTKYEVMIIDHDGTRKLKPRTSETNYLFTGFSLDLVMKLPGKEAKIKFPSSRFENRSHKMSSIFEADIRDCEIKVTRAFSRWRFYNNHHGGFEVKMSTKVVTKNSWTKMQERGVEAEAKVGDMIKAIELNASFKEHTKMNSVDEYQKEITASCDWTFKDPCYIWQEIIVVKTNKPSPFDELTIPTTHTEVTDTPNEPDSNKLLFCK